MTKRTEQRFLTDIAEHVMEVQQDNGVYRHVRFRRPGTMCTHFDLITWPGYLCYTGDMGTYVFTRVRDMFDFFRTREGRSIDYRYWAEKCESEGTRGDGLREFDPARFVREITEQRRRMFVGHGRSMDADQRRDFWDSLDDLIRTAEEGEHRTFAAVQDWSFSINKPGRWSDRTTLHIDTDDFPSCQRYTHRFVWCCNALAWGIRTYDAAKVPALPA